jgi:hypothetical protein
MPLKKSRTYPERQKAESGNRRRGEKQTWMATACMIVKPELTSMERIKHDDAVQRRPGHYPCCMVHDHNAGWEKWKYPSCKPGDHEIVTCKAMVQHISKTHPFRAKLEKRCGRFRVFLHAEGEQARLLWEHEAESPPLAITGWLSMYEEPFFGNWYVRIHIHTARYIDSKEVRGAAVEQFINRLRGANKPSN